MKRIPKETWLVILAIVIFLAWKLSTLHFRFGDENVYFYMTKAIRDGLVPYKDFNLADPPAFIYLLTSFSALIGKHFILFKLWPPLLDAGSALLIYLILRRAGARYSALGPIFYLFSFTVLSTSDYVTGAETAVFLMLLALWLDRSGRHTLSGVAWALACLSKLYIAPALIASLLYKLYRRETAQTRQVVAAGVITGALVLIPFFSIAPHETWHNLIVYQLRRPAGLEKWSVLGLFFEMEWLLILLAALGVALTRRTWRYMWPMLASFAFFLWFRDLYYLYLHLLLPFLAMLAALAVSILSYKRREFVWGTLIFYALAALYPLSSYVSIYAPQGIFSAPQEIAEKLPADLPAYGVQEVAPLVALMADRPIFQHAIDTNTQNFQTGALSIKDLSDDAVKHGIYLVSRVADYPERGIHDYGTDTHFLPADFALCSRVADFLRPSPGDPLNKVAIYRCPGR